MDRRWIVWIASASKQGKSLPKERKKQGNSLAQGLAQGKPPALRKEGARKVLAP